MSWGTSVRAASAIVGLLALTGSATAGGWSVSVGLGGCGPCCGPRYGCGPSVGFGFYRPPPVVAVPVVLAPPPVVYVPTPVYQAVPAYPAPLAEPTPLPTPRRLAPPPADPLDAPPAPVANRGVVRATAARVDTAVSARLRDLSSTDEQVRLAAVRELGRQRDSSALEHLAALLEGDASPTVRDAAARALGRIGSPRALPGLRYAAGHDPDRTVRQSAGLSAEIIER